MEIEQPDLNNMWGCMFAGDKSIKETQKKSIFIVGNTRIGKSTFFNYVSGMALRGVKDKKLGQLSLKPVHDSGVKA